MRALTVVLLAAALFAGALPAAAQFAGQVGQAWYPIVGADGKPVANHRIRAELESRIAALPGAVTVGNPQGDVTLVEFYDLNCPYCRRAAADLHRLLQDDPKLKVVLVPFPVLSEASILAARVELAVAQMLPPARFYAFHRKLYEGRGVIDGNRALAVARDFALDPKVLVEAADQESITEAMKAHVRLGNAMGLMATPAYVIKGVAVLGHPGLTSLQQIIASVRRCDQVVC
jgi:protein-disulfide isomerase